MKKKNPLILGIESSCDETSASVLRGFDVISHIIYSQVIHKKYGGVVPELASREHLKVIPEVVEQAISDANITYDELDGIAVTYGPGLMGALLVGLNFAKGLALSLDKPFLAVNHVESHLYAPMLEYPDLKPPFLCLLVSGGHTMLIDVQGIKKFEILGETLDDAAGESFDKVARLLKIGYPGGPIIDKMSKSGDKKFVKFPRAYLGKDSLDFSFSGLKTSVLNYVNKNPISEENKVDDIVASFQEAVVDVLSEKILRAVKLTQRKSVVLAGGVAANSRLRSRMTQIADENDIDLFYPPLEYCTDNAAMIGATGVLYFRNNWFSNLNINAVPNLKLGKYEKHISLD
ncbi:MAG: tRNA (adenosine(37)-N6)-threonylcarbamoyltransferase complex transferase subunit TsaD [Candidatus Marinimicrobia bacterium]|nr:tRNA (adenosine(37)-N6)-threonylcarbamoyltransferase complex transferase subunit TsaD [Candidatus Neomarinimicrobiota bacterium]